MLRRTLTAITATMAIVVAPSATAAEENSCNNIRLTQVSWTGTSTKTETASWMLERIGYETEVNTTSLPIAFQALAKDQTDIFFGMWMPIARSAINEYMKQGDIDIVTENLKDGKYTLAVNKAAWDDGVRHFEDLRENIEKFDGTIYGIESGNDGNITIKEMIDDDAYGMGDFDMQPSSEAGMLTEVNRRIDRDEWVVWLAWAPHPMAINIDMEFLRGGEEYWGPNQGESTVYTQVSKGYAWKCPNVGQFLENFTFTVEEQSRMADYVINHDMDYAEAGRKLIEENPKLLDRWFGAGGLYQLGPVKTADSSKNAKAVIEKALGI